MPRKPIRSQTLKVDEPEALCFTRRKYFTQILPVLQIFLLESFSNDSGKKKKFFSRLLYPGIAGSIPRPNESITSARTKMPVLFIEQNELKPYIPSPSLSWLHLMCGTCFLDHFFSPAQELQILVKFLMSNSLVHMFQKTLKYACLGLP